MSSGSTITSMLGEWSSSRSSIGLNLACAGPRRPKTWISIALLAFRPSWTFGGISVGSSSSAVLARMRATSRATLPTPSTATFSASSGQVRGTSGWPSYQDTKSAAP